MDERSWLVNRNIELQLGTGGQQDSAMIASIVSGDYIYDL